MRASCRTSSLLAIAVASSIGLSTSIAWADPQPAASSSETSTASDRKGKDLYASGREAYERGDYAAAAVAFRDAYELTRAPRLLFNLAQALRLAGRCSEALDYYRRYRNDATELPSDLGELEQQASGCAEAEVANKPERDAIGTHVAPAAVATSPVAPASTESAASSPRAPQPAREDSKNGGASADWPWTRWAGLSCLAVAAGSAIAATAFAVKAENASEKTSDLSKNGGSWDSAAQQNEAEGRTAEQLAVGLFVATAVTSGLGVWLLVQPATSAGVALSSGPDRVMVSWKQSVW